MAVAERQYIAPIIEKKREERWKVELKDLKKLGSDLGAERVYIYVDLTCPELNLNIAILALDVGLSTRVNWALEV